MVVRLGHAVSSENGTNGKTGAIIGDQTGKEIAFRDWYSSGSGWKWMLVCTDEEMADRAAEYMEQIVPDENYGYSQASNQRWTGYHAIDNNGGEVQGASGDFDCSSLCISCYILAGLDHDPSGYTGSMYSSLMATGKFKAYTDKEHLTSGDYARRGALYLRDGHVAMALNNGRFAGSPIEINGVVQQPGNVSIATDEEYDQPEGSYVLVTGSVKVRNEPNTSGDFLIIAHAGDKLPYTGNTEVDSRGSEWYQVETGKGIGWISAFTNKQRKHTKLVSNT